MKQLTCGDCIHFNGCYWCRKGRYTEGENDPITTCSDFERENMKCEDCGRIFNAGDIIIYGEHGCYCTNRKCSKPKEIPVARVGNYIGYPSDKRLFLKIGPQLREVITRQQNIKMVAITLTSGRINNMWPDINKNLRDLYENVKPL